MKNTHYDFLPAVLEIQETPPSPLGRFIIWLVMIMLVFFISWSALGQIDVVAESRGKLVVPRLSRPVHSAITAEITQVLVHEGQRVIKDTPLILLNSAALEAQRDEILIRQKINQLNIYRLDRFLQYADERYKDDSIALPSADKLLDTMLKRIQTNIHAYAQEKQRLIQSQEVIAAQLEVYQTQQDAADKKLPIFQKQLSAMEALHKQGHASGDSLLEIRKSVFEAELSANSAKKRVLEGRANLEQARRTFSSWQAAKTEEAQQERTERFSENAVLSAQLDQLNAQLGQYRIVAPISGVVESLAFFDRGSAIEATKELLKIVPEAEKLSAEVWIKNQDIGFLHPGQPVTVKIDTFDFTRFGWINGKLSHISSDATDHQELGLVYKATVELEKNALWIEGEKRKLEPGMSISAEIKTGKRTLLSYLLSPMLEALDSVGRQR